ncbi:MAG: hypothetical protein ABW208_21875 [Pyrinomonadaceae bacterium]
MMNRPATTSAGPEVYLRTMRILWVSFLICVGLFFLVTWLTRPSELPDELDRGGHPLLYVLAGLALSSVGASFLAKAGFYRRAAEQQQPVLVQAGFTLATALCEAGVLMGLVGVFVTRNDAAYLLFVLGALGMLLHFPRREQVEAAFRKSLM